MKTTLLNFEKPFWAIVAGGKEEMRVGVVEFDTATELETYLSDECVSADESMGKHVFNQLALYTTQELFNIDIKNELELKECECNDEPYYYEDYEDNDENETNYEVIIPSAEDYEEYDDSDECGSDNLNNF
jgi:hypothetical protein